VILYYYRVLIMILIMYLDSVRDSYLNTIVFSLRLLESDTHYNLVCCLCVCLLAWCSIVLRMRSSYYILCIFSINWVFIRYGDTYCIACVYTFVFLLDLELNEACDTY